MSKVSIKHKIRLCVKYTSAQFETICFDYGSLKNIVCVIYEDGFEVCYEQNKMPNFDVYLGQSNICEILKKCLFLFICYRKKLLCNGNIQILVDDQLVSQKSAQFFYMLSADCVIPDLDYSGVIEDVLHNTRSKYPSRVIAFESFIIAVNKQSDYEKFSYLWTAFNAFYHQFRENEKDGDAAQMKGLLRHYIGLDFMIKRERRNDVFKRIQCDSTDESKLKILCGESEKYCRLSIEQLDFALMVEMSYYLRCNYFHGSKPLPVICLENDRELIRIRWCNNALERFLSEHIFDNVKQ